MAAMASLFVKAFVKRVSDDFKQRELLPLKLLFFVHASTVFVLYPYLTIHMRELGINVKETAIMSAVTPVVAIVMPPLAGMVADRIGNFKILLASFSTAGGAVALCLLLVPTGRIVIPYPERAPLELGCAASAAGEDSWALTLRRADADTVPCQSVAAPRVSVRTEACGLVCDAPPPSLAAASLTRFSVTVRRPGETVNDVIEYTLHPDLNAKGDSHFRTEARALVGGRLFLPVEGLVHVRCDAAGCSLGSAAGWPSSASPAASPVAAPATLFSADLGTAGKSTISSVLHNTTLFLAARNLSNEGGTPIANTCRDLDQEAGVRFDVDVSKDDGIIKLSGCSSRCLVGVARKELCTDVSRIVELDVELTFWLYLVIRVFIGIVGGTAFAMFEGAVIAILREHSADYGLQRIYATIGGMISSPLSGVLIDWASRGKDYADFRPAFYLYAALKIISGLLILTINLEFKAPAKNVVADVMSVMRNVELVALMVVVFVLGTAWGFIESFLFWLLQDLGGTRSLMGITITVGGIAGIPLLVLSGPIIDRFGHANVLTFGFLFYAIRLLGYSLIYNPWLCLIFEAMESVTSSLSFTAAVTYAAKLSTSTTDTSVQGLLGGLYFGVGKGAGSLIGGYMMTWVGTRPTYQIFAAACTVVGCAYFLTHKLYLRRRPDRACNDIVKTKSTFLGGEKPPKDKADKASNAEKGEDEKDEKKEKIEMANEAQPINKAAPRSYSTDESTKEASEAEKNAHNAALTATTNETPASTEDVTNSCRVNLAFEGDDDKHKAA